MTKMDVDDELLRAKRTALRIVLIFSAFIFVMFCAFIKGFYRLEKEPVQLGKPLKNLCISSDPFNKTYYGQANDNKWYAVEYYGDRPYSGNNHSKGYENPC